MAKRIVIVDDEPNIGPSLKLILEREGYLVTLSGRAAMTFPVSVVTRLETTRPAPLEF